MYLELKKLTATTILLVVCEIVMTLSGEEQILLLFTESKKYLQPRHAKGYVTGKTKRWKLVAENLQFLLLQSNLKPRFPSSTPSSITEASI